MIFIGGVPGKVVTDWFIVNIRITQSLKLWPEFAANPPYFVNNWGSIIASAPQITFSCQQPLQQVSLVFVSFVSLTCLSKIDKLQN